MVHWVLGTVLAGAMMAHTVSHLPWAVMSIVASSVALLVGMCITKKASPSTVSKCLVKTDGQEGKSGELQIRVLEVGMETSSGTTTGEWFYFKVDGVPIRVALLERRARRDRAGYDMVAVLLVSCDANAIGDPDVRGPYIIPLAAPIASNRPLRIVTLDSGVVEAQQYAAWRCELKRVEAACTSLVWLNENPIFLKTWITNAGFDTRCQVRIVCFGASRRIVDDLMGAEARRTDAEEELVKGVASNVIALSDQKSISGVLQEQMLLTDDTYFIGEHLSSYAMSLIRVDELEETVGKIVDGQTDESGASQA
ncbi:unnamed protein product [Colletotrichum noveboracense]|uniref:MOSC domain-containing protein n=1 Tax=Colletotrichum noveboracense TaxID=2664923 RepID=A0A9W4RPG7_9PEZI|nr:unnamed protein product [Colletotrichum noveboracense]